MQNNSRYHYRQQTFLRPPKYWKQMQKQRKGIIANYRTFIFNERNSKKTTFLMKKTSRVVQVTHIQNTQKLSKVHYKPLNKPVKYGGRLLIDTVEKGNSIDLSEGPMRQNIPWRTCEATLNPNVCQQSCHSSLGSDVNILEKHLYVYSIAVLVTVIKIWNLLV